MNSRHCFCRPARCAPGPIHARLDSFITRHWPGPQVQAVRVLQSAEATAEDHRCGRCLRRPKRSGEGLPSLRAARPGHLQRRGRRIHGPVSARRPDRDRAVAVTGGVTDTRRRRQSLWPPTALAKHLSTALGCRTLLPSRSDDLPDSD